MKHIIRRMVAAGQRVSAHIKVGCDCLNVIDDGSDRRLLLNGHETIARRGVSEESFSTVIADLLSQMFKEGKTKVILVVDGGSDGLMRQVSDRLTKIIGKDKVRVKGGIPKTVEPAEFKVDNTMNMKALANNIGVLAGKVSNIANLIETARDATLMITRKRLVNSMWGADKVQNILDGVKERFENQECPWSKVATYAEVLEKSAPKLQRKIESQEADEDGMVANVLIPSVSDGYEGIRKVAAEAAVSIVPLVYIDDAFQKNTTYPATWFCDQDLMDGVSQGYIGMISFLRQIPIIEDKVIDPLSFARMRIINGAR